MTNVQRAALGAALILLIALGIYGWVRLRSEGGQVSQSQNQSQQNLPRSDSGASVSKPVPFTIVAGAYAIEPDRSVLRWKGKNLLLSHEGTISIKDGGVITADEVSFLRGEFVIDMTTIKESLGSQQLENHLKSDDFFSVSSYPESKFVYTGMQRTGDNNALVTGNLTLKGQTHTIAIPAFIENITDGYHVNAVFDIDRTRWDVRYGSGKFFQDLGDKTIDDTIVFELDAYFKKTDALGAEQK